MRGLTDTELLSDYVTQRSEAAFATLVERHVSLVYSSALRQVRDPHLAQEITQAVFIILARKAGHLHRKAVLAGWLCRTARLTACNALKAEHRRQCREQEAYMESLGQESPDEAWPQIAPLLDEAVAQLGEADRNAVVLRYYQQKPLAEVGQVLGLNADTAQKRVSRALEKLRKFFARRGVVLTAVTFAGAVSANSVQAAPAGLANTVSTLALSKGAVAGGSTLTLVKGALKVMAWTKAKVAVVVGASILLVTGTTMVVEKVITRAHSTLTRRLADGSLLSVSGVAFGDRNEFVHGGVKKSWNWPGHQELFFELKLESKNAENHPLVKPAFYRQSRCLLRGEQGIEYVEELMPNEFQNVAGGYYGYVTTSVFPRDSRWLWLRVETRESRDRYDSWQTLAEFKVANPARSANRPWPAMPTPATNSVDGLDVVLGEITVKTVPNYPHDIWNHVVTVPAEVWDHGIRLTNWSPVYVQAEDASGNWLSLLGGHRSLDPRQVWKLEMDFEMAANFPSENQAVIRVPVMRKGVLTTNVLGVPVTFTWDAHLIYLEANMPTNRPDLALKLISMQDEQGKNIDELGSSWDQFYFRRSMLPPDGKNVNVAIAVVPNVHATFYAQPKLLAEK